MRYQVRIDAENKDKPNKHGPYGALLFDKRWREKRVTILKRDKEKCRVCDSEDELQIHHRQYHYSNKLQKFKYPWEYQDDLLITLCKKCHQRGHQLYEVPIKYY